MAFIAKSPNNWRHLSGREGGLAPALPDFGWSKFSKFFLMEQLMRRRIPLVTLVFAGLMIGTIHAQQPALDTVIDRNIASLVATYKMLHAAPELSHHEEKTSTFFAAQLRAMGY